MIGYTMIEIDQDLIPGSGRKYCTASIHTGSETHTGWKWPALVKNMYSSSPFPSHPGVLS
jgi:hypothetical protein